MQTQITAGDLVISTTEARVFKAGTEIVLTSLEYRLLLIFAGHMGQVLSRGQLLENLWDAAGDFVNDNTLTVYIKRLRDKIEDDPQEPQYIKTVRGLGYRFERRKRGGRGCEKQGSGDPASGGDFGFWNLFACRMVSLRGTRSAVRSLLLFDCKCSVLDCVGSTLL